MKSKGHLTLTMDENYTNWLVNLPRGKHICYPAEREADAKKLATWIAQYGTDCHHTGWKQGLVAGSIMSIAICVVVGGMKIINDLDKKYKNQDKTKENEEA